MGSARCVKTPLVIGSSRPKHFMYEDVIEAVMKVAAECDTPEKAREFLQRSGVLDSEGKLTEVYGTVSRDTGQ